MSTLQIDPRNELASLRRRLAEAEETLEAIRSGAVDAIVVDAAGAPAVYTLKSAADPYRALVEKMAEGALTVSFDGVILYANAAFARMIALPVERVIGLHFADFVADFPNDELKKALQQTTRYDVLLRKSGGQILHARVSRSSVIIDDLHVFCLTVTDLSGQELRLRHEALINSCADAIYTLTVDGTITTWNPAAERLYGYRSQEAVGRRIHVLVPPEQQEEISSILSRVTHGETFHRETVRVCKAGKSIDVALSVSPIQSSDGNVEGISVIARDITDRKRIEGGLKERLAEIEALYDNAPIGLALFDHDFRFLRINEALAEMNGTAAVEHIGRAAWDIVPTLRSGVESNFRQVLQTGEVVEAEISGETPKLPGVTRFWHEKYYPLRTPDGRIAAIGATVEEITERKHNEQRLQQTSDRLRLALEAGHMGVWDWDLMTGGGFWDAAEYKLCGYAPDAPDAPIGDEFFNIVHPDDREQFAQLVERSKSSYESFVAEFRIIRPNGSVCWLLGQGKCIRDLDGVPVRMIGVNFDITDRKRSEDARELLLRELDHRVKNLFAMISALIGLSARHCETPQQLVASLRDRLSALSGAYDLIRGTDLDNSVSVDQVLTKALAPFLSQRRVSISDCPVLISANAAISLTLIMHELATNAVKYGALSVSSGHLCIESTTVGPGREAKLVIHWNERGGPPVSVPNRKGFGSMLLAQSARGLGGTIDLEYGVEGLTATIKAPLTQVATTIGVSDNEKSGVASAVG